MIHAQKCPCLISVLQKLTFYFIVSELFILCQKLPIFLAILSSFLGTSNVISGKEKSLPLPQRLAIFQPQSRTICCIPNLVSALFAKGPFAAVHGSTLNERHPEFIPRQQ